MSAVVLLVQIQEPAGAWVDVGVLRGTNNTNWFAPFESYWDLPRRPVLGQVFEDQPRTWRPSSHVALPNWFSHLLPEGRLRQAVATAAGISPSTELQLLATLGAEDLPGAVRVSPWNDDSAPNPPTASADDDAERESDPVLKFSLAGLQMKFSIHKDDRGLTLPVSGRAGNMILKLPDNRIGFEGVPEAEFAAMMLAREAGIRVPQVELVDARSVEGLGHWGETGGRYSFAVSRFDRGLDGRRIHAEEFAQILNIPAARKLAKYSHTNFEAVAKVAAGLSGTESVAEVIDRIVLNVMVGNGDAHLKNWAMIYPDGMNPTLSAAYDIVPTVLYVNGDDLGLNLNGSKRFEDVYRSSFGRMGRVTDFGEQAAITQAREAVERVRNAWHILGDLLPAEQFDRLTKRLTTLPIVDR